MVEQYVDGGLRSLTGFPNWQTSEFLTYWESSQTVVTSALAIWQIWKYWRYIWALNQSSTSVTHIRYAFIRPDGYRLSPSESWTEVSSGCSEANSQNLQTSAWNFLQRVTCFVRGTWLPLKQSRSVKFKEALARLRRVLIKKPSNGMIRRLIMNLVR